MNQVAKTPLLRSAGTARLLPAAVLLLAAAIFVADTFLALPDAVAVLYVVVVILSGTFLDQRSLVLVTAGCAAAAIVSYLMEYGATLHPGGSARLVVSLVAIVLTGGLAAANRAAAANVRRQEEMLATAQAELAHVGRVAMLGEMTASLAHEINQPLAAIVTNGEVSLRLLARDPPDIQEVREAITDMIAAGRRGSEIIKRLRGLFRKGEGERTAIGPNDLVREAVALIGQDLSRRNIVLRLDLGDGLPAVDGDKIQLEQVIINLLLNGAQAMEEVIGRARDLVIRTRLADPRRVSVAVEDNGAGIDAHAQQHLFEAFFTTKPGGLGMGLPICRSIVENHGGTLRGTNNAGRVGATFEFTLPVAARMRS